MKNKIKKSNQKEITFESYLRRSVDKNLEKRKADKYAYDEGVIDTVKGFFSSRGATMAQREKQAKANKKTFGRTVRYWLAVIRRKLGSIWNSIKENYEKIRKKGGIWAFIKELFNDMVGGIGNWFKKIASKFGYNASYEHRPSKGERVYSEAVLKFGNIYSTINSTYTLSDSTLVNINSVTMTAEMRGAGSKYIDANTLFTTMLGKNFNTASLSGNTYTFTRKDWNDKIEPFLKAKGDTEAVAEIQAEKNAVQRQRERVAETARTARETRDDVAELRAQVATAQNRTMYMFIGLSCLVLVCFLITMYFMYINNEEDRARDFQTQNSITEGFKKIYRLVNEMDTRNEVRAQGIQQHLDKATEQLDKTVKDGLEEVKEHARKNKEEILQQIAGVKMDTENINKQVETLLQKADENTKEIIEKIKQGNEEVIKKVIDGDEDIKKKLKDNAYQMIKKFAEAKKDIVDIQIQNSELAKVEMLKRQQEDISYLERLTTNKFEQLAKEQQISLEKIAGIASMNTNKK